MSDLAASPQTDQPVPPAVPRAPETGDIDIELLLDQAQALVDDTADQFAAEPGTTEPQTAEIADASDASDLAGLPASFPVDRPARAELPAEIVALLVAGGELPASPPAVAPSPAAEPAPEALAPAATLPEQAAPVEDGAAPADAPAAPAEETPQTQPNAILVEDFGIPAAPGVQSAAPAPALTPAIEPAAPDAPALATKPKPERLCSAARPMRFLAVCLIALDRPFARVSEEARRRVGWIAITTFLMGTVAWLLPLFRTFAAIHK
jgi:hypothetical protein